MCAHGGACGACHHEQANENRENEASELAHQAILP